MGGGLNRLLYRLATYNIAIPESLLPRSWRNIPIALKIPSSKDQ